MRHFSPEDRLVRTREMLSTDLDQETVLMSIDQGVYYGMARTARTIWQRLETPLTFSALVDELVKEYEVTSETCAADLQEFLGAMERGGLLRVE